MGVVSQCGCVSNIVQLMRFVCGCILACVILYHNSRFGETMVYIRVFMAPAINPAAGIVSNQDKNITRNIGQLVP